ncbi:hypothetical protein KVR01_010738 [Diaporthe batatas]|uniref:uncharacterized protein n=1 Tax=Diaporthe batatas TaxID=748121 RepID=UPI001D04FCAA|nr:uncharacterized protein KVR01_010738 [Diaporthe batatas]KAG8159077.1 hypothetical protein KVR01_010738 [Diaporthe batatas]
MFIPTIVAYPATTAAACVAIAVSCASVYALYQLFFSPLSSIPGPFWAKLTSFPRLNSVLGNATHIELVNYHKKYGTVVRIGPNALSVTDPTAFREIYKAGNKFIKTESMDVLNAGRSFDLAGERNEKVHGEQRKLVARAYSLESMIQLEPRVDETVQALLNKFDEITGQTIDLAQWFQLFAFADNRNGYFNQFAWREIHARKDRGGDDRDILGKLLEVQRGKHQMKDIDIAFMMTSNVTAGSDTTSIALSSVFHYLLRNPDTHRSLMSELEDKAARGELSPIVTASQAGSCAYLQAVIYEALRLRPSVGLTLDRVVPPGGMTIDGHFVPEGTEVGTSAWALHREPSIWGSDAESFRPERWLGKENEGLNISWLEIEKLVPTLLMRYNFRLAPHATLTDDCG